MRVWVRTTNQLLSTVASVLVSLRRISDSSASSSPSFVEVIVVTKLTCAECWTRDLCVHVRSGRDSGVVTCRDSTLRTVQLSEAR